MERLTIEKAGSILVKDLSGGYTSPCFGCESIGNCASKKIQPCAIYRALEKLKNCEDLEEQGKLLKLPCAVGNTVYCIYDRYTKCSAHNEEFEGYNCQGCESECDSRKEYYVQEQKAYSLDWIVTQIVNKHFGKIVFLTKSAAEAALQRMKETEVG